MIQAIIGALILMGVYRFMNAKSEYEVTWQLAFMFILGPAILHLIFNLAIVYFALNPYFGLLGYLLYILVPFLSLRFGFEYDLKPALVYSSIVLPVAIVTEVIVVFGVSMVQNA